MATTYYFDRDTKVYAHVPATTAGTKSMYYELPVLDGFSLVKLLMRVKLHLIKHSLRVVQV